MRNSKYVVVAVACVAAGVARSAWASTGFSMINSTVTYTANHLTLAPPQTSNLGSFHIVINPGAGLSGNPTALAAFNRAAAQWEKLISDPITININADLGTVGPDGNAFPANVIGSTVSVGLAAGYTTIRNAMVTDAAAQPANANNAIVASLPTAAQFTAVMPAGRGLNGSVSLSKADAKALGFAGLDLPPASGGFGPNDGTIVFNSAFSFDFDNTNGSTAGTEDFETVAAHEIGHALGFTSNVDAIDVTTAAQLPTISPSTLDLYRFGRTASNPTTAADFTTFPRNLAPNADVITDDTSDEFGMSTGVVTGDGRQASHWKDDQLTGVHIGIMDPTLGFASVATVQYPDLRALDLIGYDLVLWTPGDLNHDGKVNFADLLKLSQNYNLSPAKWTDGDFNGNGIVNFDDLLLLAQNYGFGGAGTFEGNAALAQAVPEPASLSVLGLGALSLVRRRGHANGRT